MYDLLVRRDIACAGCTVRAHIWRSEAHCLSPLLSIGISRHSCAYTHTHTNTHTNTHTHAQARARGFANARQRETLIYEALRAVWKELGRATDKIVGKESRT
jgi:hypothetical protein